MDTERWRDIPDRCGYMISDRGRVARIMKPYEQWDGRKSIAFGKGRTYKRLSVSRLVLTVFKRPPTKLEKARHLNRDLTDTRLENLDWKRGREKRGDARG